MRRKFSKSFTNSKDNILFLFRIINNLMYELKMNREKIVAS